MLADVPREFVGYGKDRPVVVWPGGARIAISLVVNYEEGSERTPLYGDSTTDPMTEGFAAGQRHRQLHNESFFDYGTRVAFWRLLEVFDAYAVPVTFYACAVALEQNPEAARAITAHGHEPCSHGYRWLPSYSLTADEEREHVRKAVESIARTTGQRPLGWNTRGPSLRTRELLVEEGGFLYDSDGYADDLPYFVGVNGRKWLVIPYTFETNDMKLWRPPGTSSPEDFYDYLTEAFDCLYDEGARQPQMLSVGLHMRHAGRPGRIGALERFIRYAKSFPSVWFARRVDIARWWLDHYGHLPAMAS
jgi:peptidoglycan/xylan/chitin deacetylase (PgdA/CDA1 family)